MRNSNTCREGTVPRAALRWLVAVSAAAWLVPAACALDPHRLVQQYIRDYWNDEQGYPGGSVNAFAQTPDGYLWIGGENGLVRFDGLSFRLFDHANTTGFPASSVLGLATDSEGDLFIRLLSREVLRYHNGIFEPVSALNEITAMAPGIQGDILLFRPTAPMRYLDRKLVRIPSAKGYTGRLAISIAETHDGTVWIGTRDYGLIGLRDGRSFVPRGLPDPKVNSLLPANGDTLWVGTDHGLALWNGKKLDATALPAPLRRVQVMAMARDRDSNIWLGTAQGLIRMTAAGEFSQDHRETGPAEAVSSLFEDREGNLWIGRGDGIERYRDTVFLTYASAATGSSGDNGPVYVDPSGRTWHGPSTGGLFYLQDGQRFQVTDAGIGDDVVYSIDGGPGEVWIGRQRGGLTRLLTEGGSIKADAFTAANGLAPGPVYAVHRSRDGTVWAGTLGGGVSRLDGGRITTFTTANGLASNTISAIAEGTGGILWVATANGLNSFDHGHWAAYTNMPPGRINCLFADPAGVLWIGTDAGLAFLRNGRVQLPAEAPDPLLDAILGLVDDGRGWLWIATSKHVVRVSRDRLLGDAPDAALPREFGPADGIPAPEGVRRDRSVVKDAAGRIWLSLRWGISVVDPAAAGAGSVPAIVQIQSVSADGSPLNAAVPFRIPLSRKRIRFDYLALSLSVPERVRYRYRLDGFDRDWSEPLSAREAVYMNLPAGSYRFRVIASNSEGLWNSVEASAGIQMVPAFWQTSWFRLLLLAACGLGATGIYRMRLRRLTRQLNMRFEERLAERTVIAQELHDTLLQGLLSASMQLHVAVGQLPGDSPARPQFTRIMELMRQVVNESRNAVRGLRSPSCSLDDLETALSKVRDEYAEAGPEFRIIVDGQSRPLNPLIRDEVYRIGREALTNAFRHSGASRVEMQIHYQEADLRLAVRDSGCGIDEKVLQSGREGHWGLVGMRERAEKIGAHLKVWSRAAAGTELELTVPGQIAFPAPDGAAKRSRFLLWRRGEAAAESRTAVRREKQ